MRVFVAGGTGFVGARVVDRLLEDRHDVTVLVHRDPGPWPEQPRLSRVRGNVLDPASYRAHVGENDAIVDLVGILKEHPDKGVTFERMHVGVVRDLVGMAQEHGIRRFVYVSANGAAPEGTPYQVTKHRAEEALKASGLEWTIFRPSFVTGTGHGAGGSRGEAAGFDEQFAQVAGKLGAYPDFGGGRFRIQPVALADVAQAIARSLETPDAIRKTYCLAGPSEITWHDYLGKLRAASGVWRPIVYTPVVAGKLAAAALSRFKWFPATPDSLEMLVAGNTCDPGEAVQDLGLTLTPFDVALRGVFEGTSQKVQAAPATE